MVGFLLCAWFTFSFSSFCDVSRGTSYNHLQLLILSYTTAGPIKAYCFSLSDNLLHSGAPSAQVTPSFSNIPKSLPPGQIPYFQDLWMTGDYDLSLLLDQCNSIHAASVAWYAQETLPLNNQPSTGGVRSSCASVPITSEAAQTLL